MSKEWNFHCKTCDREPERFPGFNHGEDILRSMYKVRKHAYAIQEQDTKDITSGQIGYISVEVMGNSYTYAWQFLHEHEGHEMELLSEYGDTEPIESDGQMSNMKRLQEDMESTNNICERCGGLKTFYYAVQAVYSDGHTEGTPPPDVPVSNRSMRICTCPLLMQEHNGSLDDHDTHDWRHASVHMQPDYTARDGSQLVVIYGCYADGTSCRVSIDPKQALSLLEWLSQNREKLEQMAGEDC